MPEDKEILLEMVEELARFGIVNQLSVYELSSLAVQAARYMFIRRENVVDDFTSIDDEAKDWELGR